MKLIERISDIIDRIRLFINDLRYLTTTLDNLQRDSYRYDREIDEINKCIGAIRSELRHQASQTKREL